MRTLLLLILTTFCLACAKDLSIQPDLDQIQADTQIAQSDKEAGIFTVVDEQAVYPGGMGAWSKYLKENLTYPATAKEKGIEGAVFLTFVVAEDGAISNAQVIRGIGGNCDEEALRIIKESPDWLPGKIDGEIVKSRMQVRIVFRNKNAVDPLNSSESATITGSINNSQNRAEDVHMTVDQTANFPGGMGEWMKFVTSNLKYPQQAKKEGIEGAVFITFVVEEDGTITNTQLVRGIGGTCDEEALRVVNLSPKWVPGKKDGRIVKSRMQIRMVFRNS